jgi:demethylmenaquinone methyltransferase/2-methoxy-6-polyprenyl-1,4-benzoquinol methylase
MSVAGAKPVGAKDEADAARAVQQMFDSIAPRYDLLNHVLSANVDRLWWWKAARTFRTILADPNAAVLDICCGTGDMTMALLKRRPVGARPVLAADFSRGMLSRGAKKFGHSRLDSAPYAVPLEADALHLPLRDASLDLIVTAFGFRNLANYEAGLREFYRVLKPGGRLGILDFAEPGGLMGKAYAVYFRRVLPGIGRLIGGATAAGKAGPYTYLPTSVGNFPPPAEMLAMVRGVGYQDCAWQPYTFGIAGLYSGTRI